MQLQKKIKLLPPQIICQRNKKRVAAYARVSTDLESTQNSLAAQISYYSEYIQEHEDWEFAGVYADNGISGTRNNREMFQALLEECEKGNVDLILTKSISRFARNTLNLLETVRHLKEIGVEVRFSRENISSFTGDGELLLTILASFAQEESRSISENVKWSIRKGFEQGKTNSHKLYGYRWRDGNFVIEPAEAQVIQYVYRRYLEGASIERLQEELKEQQVKSATGVEFANSTVRGILRQEKYTGNMVLQKTYVENHITHRRRINHGEVPMYYVEHTHPAIIEKEQFDQVQEEIKRRQGLGIRAIPSLQLNCFSGKIKCGSCGASFRRHRKRRADDTLRISWGCYGKERNGVKSCNSVRISEDMLKEACTRALGSEIFQEAEFGEKVKKILIIGGYWMHFYLSNDRLVKVKWDSRIERELRRQSRYRVQGERMRGNQYARRENKYHENQAD